MDINYDSFFDELGLMAKEAGVFDSVVSKGAPLLSGLGRAAIGGAKAVGASGGKLLSQGGLKGGVGQFGKNVGGAIRGGFAQGQKVMSGPNMLAGAGVLGAGALGAGVAGKAAFGGGGQQR